MFWINRRILRRRCSNQDSDHRLCGLGSCHKGYTGTMSPYSLDCASRQLPLLWDRLGRHGSQVFNGEQHENKPFIHDPGLDIIYFHAFRRLRSCWVISQGVAVTILSQGEKLDGENGSSLSCTYQFERLNLLDPGPICGGY